MAVRGNGGRERRQPHEIRALGDDALARLDALERPARGRPRARRASRHGARTTRLRAGRTRSAGQHRPRSPPRERPAAAPSRSSADAGTPTVRPARPAARLSNANVIGSVRDCGSSTLPTLDQASRRDAAVDARHFDFRGCRRAGRARRPLPAPGRRRAPATASTTRKRTVPAVDVRAGRGFTLRDHAADRRADDERAPRRPSAPPARAALYCARLASAAVEPRLAPALRLRVLRRAACRARPGRRQPLGAFAIPRRKCERGLRLGARALELRQIAGNRRRRQQPREFLPRETPAPNGDVGDTDESTIDRCNDVSRASGSGFEPRRRPGSTREQAAHGRPPCRNRAPTAAP